MTCSSLEALCLVVDCEINRELRRKDDVVARPRRFKVQGANLHPTSSHEPQATLRPSPSALLSSFIKVEESYNRLSCSGALPVTTCGSSEMSDQEHYTALNHEHADDHISGIPAYPFMDEGLQAYARKYALHGDAPASLLEDDDEQKPHLIAAPTHSKRKGSRANGDSTSSQPLPLFQAKWTPRGERGASDDAVHGRPAEATRQQTSASARKREYVEDEEEAPSRKQPRLTGFAARMSGTSSYRGVSWHTQTSRWKAQIKVAGKDVNLGRHRDEVEAARAYDRAAICARGAKDAKLNFEIVDYQLEIPTLVSTPLTELAASLRGVEQRLQAQTSRFHGVRLNKRTSKWEAYIRVAGKHVHLGCYDSEVNAAQAFDQAALVRQAHNLGAMGGKPQLVTNFPPMIYLEFTNQLFQLANPLMNGAAVEFNKTSAGQSAFCKLEDKYVQNLLQKCREQGGSLTAYPTITS